MSPSTMALEVRNKGSQRYQSWEELNARKIILALKIKWAISHSVKKLNQGAKFCQQSKKTWKKTLAPGGMVPAAPWFPP